ncbi:MAG TPA: PhoH family protein [Bacteroidales bacterium]|nr:PhoH family protein [Bacteroidales bacterium]HQH18367.1 PhoH family protein [Bacteroidales bacterium]HQI44767.1 PhoH family protein [Bacteroidales bacterium]
MTEKTIILEAIDPVEIFGVNEKNLELIRSFFPKIKIIARGDMIKMIGDKSELEQLEERLFVLIKHYEKFGKITEKDISYIVDPTQTYNGVIQEKDVLVHGKNGVPIKARTVNQQKMVESYEKNDMIFAIGPAGTGKTYTSVALAVRALKNKEVKRIILTRPAVEAGENLGFLPGDLKDKLDPYLQPLYDALRDMLPPQKLYTYMEDGTIEVAPLAFMRGRTLENAFAILDEAQNATEPQMKMFLTRMGRNSKFIITGDVTQIDLPRNQSSGLIHSIHILKNTEGIDFIMLDKRDIVRHKLVNKIVEAYELDKKNTK